MNITRVSILMTILFMIVVNISLAMPQLQITMPSEITAYVDEDTYFNITLSNTGDTRIYNVTFPEIRATYFPNITTLDVSETTTMLGRISPGGEFSSDYVLNIWFYYLVEDTPVHQTIVVTFDNDSFSEDMLDININDTVVFENKAGIDSTLREFDNKLPDMVIYAGSDDNMTFPTVDEYMYYHTTLGFTLDIIVENETVGSYAHDNDYDISFPFRVVSKHKPGVLQLEILTSDIDINYNSKAQAILDIKNTGTGTAYDIELEAPDWIEFKSNDFNLESDENKIVLFDIEPDNITKTKETNRTHYLTISAKGSNTQKSNIDAEVFIKYHDFGEVEVGNVSYKIIELNAEESIALCSQNPEYPGCDALIIEKEVEKVIETEPTHEFSEAEVSNIKESASKVGDSTERTENRISAMSEDMSDFKKDFSLFKTNMTSLMFTMQDYMINEQKKDKSSSIKKTIAIIIGIMVLIGSGVFAFIRYYQYKQEVFDEYYSG